MSPQCSGVLVVYRSPRSTLESMQGGRCGYRDANSPKLHNFSLDRLERCCLADSSDEIYAHLPAWRKVPDHRIIAQKIFGSNSIDLWIVSIRRAEGRGNSSDVLVARSDQQIHALGGPNDPVHSQCRCPNQFVLDPTSLQSIEHATKLVSIHSAKTSKTSNGGPTEMPRSGCGGAMSASRLGLRAHVRGTAQSGTGAVIESSPPSAPIGYVTVEAQPIARAGLGHPASLTMTTVIATMSQQIVIRDRLRPSGALGRQPNSSAKHYAHNDGYGPSLCAVPNRSATRLTCDTVARTLQSEGCRFSARSSFGCI